MRIPYSALLHYCLIELSPVWLTYGAVKNLIVKVVEDTRARNILISDLYTQAATANVTLELDVLDIRNCILESAIQDIWRDATYISHENFQCGPVTTPMHLTGKAPMVHFTVLGVTVGFISGCLILFTLHGGLHEASDFASGHYLALSWAVQRRPAYRALLLVYLVMIIAEVSFSLTFRSTQNRLKVIWPQLALILICSLATLSLDRPPVKWDSLEFRQRMFKRPWYRFFQTNIRFVCTAMGTQWLEAEGMDLPNSSFLTDSRAPCADTSSDDTSSVKSLI